MKFVTPLREARLIKRYKRFLADVETPDGQVMTIHCPNTGSMRHCLEPGERLWWSLSDNPKRKLPGTWEVACLRHGRPASVAPDYALINTARPNALVAEALLEDRIAPLKGYDAHRREARLGQRRLDFCLTTEGRPPCWVEVKNVTLLEQPDTGLGMFPDAVSQRATAHLHELMACVARGERAVLLFCVGHTGIRSVTPAADIDPVYARTLQDAYAAGVELLAYGVSLTQEQMQLTIPVPVMLETPSC